jgi:uncharacterized caspase-like protein
MWRCRILGLVLISISFAVSGGAAAEKRVALVIGNSAYQHAPELENPRNDAADMAAALMALGIEVIEGLDLDKQAMDHKIRDFSKILSGADAGIFFYAGHGLQVNGTNYLVPVDAELSTAAALEFEMVRLDVVQRIMEEEAKTNVLFLDACRNNPLSRNLARAMGTRAAGIGQGLAPVESGVGTLISFSTQPGNVALDGTGRNSPFAGALIKHITASSDPLSDLLVAVRNDVMEATGKKQVPWEHSALTGRFYFKPPLAAAVTETAAPVGGAGSTANLLLTHTFEWIDNGNRIGTITFMPDGLARDTWSPVPNTWRIDTNGDLIITNFAFCVTRLTFDGKATFSGRRDPTSKIQDGVQTRLQAL